MQSGTQLYMEISAVADQLGREGNALIKDVCDVAWTRLPGSEGEAKAQLFLKGKMQEIGIKQIDQPTYRVYSKFFLWWPRVSVILFFISYGLYLIAPAFALVFAILMLLNLALKLFSFTFFDVFFKRNPSSNVIGKIPAKKMGSSGKPKRIVLIGGHTDSNYEYPIGKKIGTGLVKIAIPIVVMMGIWILICLIKTILFAIEGKFAIETAGEIAHVFTQPDWAFYLMILAMPFLLFVGFNMVVNRPVPGANDNLSGVAVTMETLKWFAKPENQLHNIELWGVCFGCEEGGMMGSKVMSKWMKKELDAGTFPAESVWIVNFDSIGDKGPLLIATKEPLYRAWSHHPDVYNQLVQSAKNAGVPYILKSLSAGTDSAPFSRLGIPACGIVCMGLDGHTPANWHALEDTPDRVDVGGIINSMKLSLQFLSDVDKSLN